MKHLIYKLTFAAALATFLTGTLSAQESSPLITVRIIEVDQGKTGEFVDLQKTLMEAQKKAGRPGRSVWQEARGNTNVFHIVNDAENFAELDSTNEPIMSDSAWANWINRISDVTVSRQVLTLRNYEEGTIAPKKGSKPNLLRLNLTTLSSRRDATAYTDWVIEKLAPAQRKLGVTGRSLSRVVVGDNPATVVAARRFSSWAEMDAPNPLSKLSSADRSAIFDAQEGIEFHEIKSLILRYRADLSFER